MLRFTLNVSLIKKIKKIFFKAKRSIDEIFPELHALQIEISDSQENYSFPQAFSVNLRKLTNNEYLSIRFLKIDKHDLDYPIANSDIYVHSLNETLIKIEKNHSYEANF